MEDTRVVKPEELGSGWTFFTRGLEGEPESSVTSGKASLDEVFFWKETEKRGCFRHSIESR